MRASLKAILAALTATLVAGVGSASAVTITLGRPDLTSPAVATYECSGSCAWFTVVQAAWAPGSIGSVPGDGRITGWRLQAPPSTGTGEVRLLVLRPVADGKFQATWISSPATVFDGQGINAADLPVEPGDTIAVNTRQSFTMPGTGTAAVRLAAAPAPAASTGIGILQPPTIAAPSSTSTPGQELLVNADVALDPPNLAAISPASGPTAGGTTVTIAGLHLAPVIAVTFGDVPATSISGDRNIVTAVSPPHEPGLVEVRVTTAGGRSAPAGFTYVAPPPPPDTAAPVLSALRITPATFRAGNLGGPLAAAKIGARVAYTLSEPATVTLTLRRSVAGRRLGTRCVAPTKRTRRARRCKRLVAVRGSFTHAGATGQNRFTLTGRLGGRALAAASYRLDAVAADAAGNRSGTQSRAFRIVLR